jgi:putative tricarboxylic transport membrane protein
MTTPQEARQVRMTIPDLVAAGIAVLAASWAVIESGRWPAPEFIGGPALIPRIIAGILFVAAALLIWNAVRGRSSPIDEPLDFAKQRRIAVMLLVTAAYAAALEPVGFLPSTIVYLAVFTLVLGLRDWRVIGAYSLLLPVAFYIVFSRGLKVPLPPTDWLF